MADDLRAKSGYRQAMSDVPAPYDLAPESGPTAPPPFIVRPPSGVPTPFVFAVPHSGRYYPPALMRASRLALESLRQCEDAYVDRLFGAAPEFGAALLVATHARSYLDLNRAANELDATMFDPMLGEDGLHNSHRVKAGLGIIPRQVAEGLVIYDAPLPAREAGFRIDSLHKPYHDKLRALLEARKRQFDRAVLIDCHSMPSDSAPPRRRGRGTLSGPDIVLGDCWGTACGRELADLAESLLIRSGFSVRRNVPYAGGYVTQHYGSPGAGVHALQIEISRALYMDEDTLVPHEGFQEVAANLRHFTSEFIRQAARYMPAPKADDLPRAAE